MKGIVFTELLDMVETLYGEDLVDDILDDCDLESEGAYTTIGTYDYQELIQIVSNLSRRSDTSVKALLHTYGSYLFQRFNQMMPAFFEKPKTVFEFLESVHDYIHVEVKKLYSDAQLPAFETARVGDDTFIMVYKSRCPFADFAHGLIKGCILYYGENIQIEEEDRNEKGQFCRVFTLRKIAA